MSIDRLIQPGALAAMALTPCLVSIAIALYSWWLHRAPERPPSKRQAGPAWPSVDLIVPVFNESKLLAGKLTNVAGLRYVRDRLRIIIVDGASTDGSREIAEAWARSDDRAIVVAAEHPGKATQLNLALRHGTGAWVVVTDADAEMPPNTLQALMRAGRDSNVGAIGSPVLPRNTHPAEHLYGHVLNWLRLREWRRGSASTVMGPCYAFRRSLIDRIPDDVVSDDVHVAWRVAIRGGAIGLAGPVVHEIRETSTLPALFRQKVRRGSGYFREIFRFLPRVRGMKRAFSMGFVLRCCLMLLGPVLALSAFGLTVAAARWLQDQAAASTALIGFGLLVTAVTLDRRLRRSLVLGTIIPLAAAVALLTYPVRRTRHYGAALSMKRTKRRPAYSP